MDLTTLEITLSLVVVSLVRLPEDLVVSWRGRQIIVPKGFSCDGCSVPEFLWISVSPKIDERTLRGAIVHDYLYRNTPEGWTRKEADLLFYDFIRADGLNWWKSNKAYYGVRLFGSSSWQAK